MALNTEIHIRIKWEIFIKFGSVQFVASQTGCIGPDTDFPPGLLLDGIGTVMPVCSERGWGKDRFARQTDGGKDDQTQSDADNMGIVF